MTNIIAADIRPTTVSSRMFQRLEPTGNWKSDNPRYHYVSENGPLDAFSRTDRADGYDTSDL